MNHYLVKPTVEVEGKSKKQQYVVKAESNVLADATCVLNLPNVEIKEIPDVNKKNWVDVIPNEEGGNWYDVVCEWDTIEGKTVKDPYLIQKLSIDDAISKAYEVSPNCEITSIKKATILDYFIQEEEV